MSQKWVLDKHGGPEGLRIVDFDLPTAACLPPTSVTIRVQATTATYTDQMIMKGNYQPSPPLPLTPGYDAVGEVVAVGSSVGAVLKVGDRVAAMPQAHCMATHITLDHTAVIKVPKDSDPREQVACIRTGVTAYQMLHRCCASRLAEPKNVSLLIHGAAGATGSVLLSLALSAGIRPEHIYATAKGSNLSILSAFRVKAIDYETEDWSKRVLDETQGKGVDLVFDAVCLNGYYEKGIACLSHGGKYVSYGFTSVKNATDAGSLSIPSVLWFFLKQSWQHNVCSWFDGREAEFYIISSRRDAKPDEFKDDLLQVLSMVQSQKLVLAGGRTWRFAQCKEALTAIAQNATVGLQIITME